MLMIITHYLFTLHLALVYLGICIYVFFLLCVPGQNGSQHEHHPSGSLLGSTRRRRCRCPCRIAITTALQNSTHLSTRINALCSGNIIQPWCCEIVGKWSFQKVQRRVDASAVRLLGVDQSV